MNKTQPKRVILFFAVFAFLAILITSVWNQWQHPAQQQSPISVAGERQEPQRPISATTERQASPASPIQQQSTRSSAEDATAARERYLARYLNSGFSRKPGVKLIAVAIVSDDGKFSRTVNTAVADKFKNDSTAVLTSLFRPPFVTDGLFSSLLNGSTEVLDKLELSKAVDVLFLGREEISYSTDASLENILTANIRLEITAITAADGQNRSWTFVANGAGFKQTEARLMAEERLIKQITTDSKMSLNFQ